jgi:molybdopterin biosynthesis enzyme
MLVGRQIIYVHLHTDYTNPGTEQMLSSILRNQNVKTQEMVERMGEMVSQIDEALRQTEFLRDEAVRVLALYKAQYLKEQKPPANPK